MGETTPVTPTQELVMELLAARARLGESEWSVSTRHMAAIKSLDGAGLAKWRSHVIEGHVYVSLTDKGRSEYLSGTYVPPIMDRVEALRRRCENFTRGSCRDAHSGRQPGATYKADAYCDPCELARAIDGTAR